MLKDRKLEQFNEVTDLEVAGEDPREMEREELAFSLDEDAEECSSSFSVDDSELARRRRRRRDFSEVFRPRWFFFRRLCRFFFRFLREVGD